MRFCTNRGQSLRPALPLARLSAADSHVHDKRKQRSYRGDQNLQKPLQSVYRDRQ